MKYKDAGVDIDAGNRLVDRIKPLAEKTSRKGVVGSLGGFGALFDLSAYDFKQPVLVSCTDGVGTKLKLAIETGMHDGVGIDLVAMCVNDLICGGATPLFFLDYYATGKLELDVAEKIISGIAKGCEQASCALVGGETAEMPGMYATNDYDLAGFSVGAVEKNKIIDGSNVQPGDVLIGLASIGPHSNGYSLIRKIIEDKNIDLNSELDGKTLKEILLTPTKIYVKAILDLIQKVQVKAIAHITGGGITENLPRVLPKNLQAKIDFNTWQRPKIFDWLQEQGEISEEDMLKTFNCGVGMVVCVSESDKLKALEILAKNKEEAMPIGSITE